jgi:glutamine amidotransferase
VNNKIGIIDYGMGNLFSLKNTIESLGFEVIISRDYDTLYNTRALILPGVGAFDSAMENFTDYGLEKLNLHFIETNKYFLGNCLGMQLLFSKSYENDLTNGLDIIKGEVKRFDNDFNNFTVPRVDWGNTEFIMKDIVFDGLMNSEYMYYVHSFYTIPEDKSIISSISNYCNIDYCTGIIFNNIYAFQFHPEKSSNKGKKIIENFLKKTLERN